MASFAVTVSSNARNLTSPAVLDAAAEQVPGETPASIAATIGYTTDATNGIINMTVTTDEADRPLAIANAVAAAFVADRTAAKSTALQERIDDLDTQLTDIEARLADLNSQLADAQAVGADTSGLQVQIETTRSRFEAALGSREDARLQLSLVDPGVGVLNPAAGATQEDKPSPLKRGLLGAGIGLVIGVMLAAVRETLDSRVRSRAAAESTAGTTVIAELPEERIKSKRHEIPIIDQPAGALAEAVRGLRTTLRYLGTSKPIRSIVVTSPQAGDGKTMTAANLAASFAVSGVSTILVSADLRRPGVDDLFQAHGRVGLSDVLAGRWPGPPSAPRPPANAGSGGAGTIVVREPDVSAANLEPLLQPTRLRNLRILPAGRIPPNPAELLSSDRAAKMLAALGDLAEMVIVDSPPTVVSDSSLLAGLVDGVIVVVAVDRTRKGALRRARQSLEPAGGRLLGIALNRVHGRDQTYSGYYGYKSSRRQPHIDLTDR
jgi:Mrp family chromosome partitioning ATPase